MCRYPGVELFFTQRVERYEQRVLFDSHFVGKQREPRADSCPVRIAPQTVTAQHEDIARVQFGRQCAHFELRLQTDRAR